MWHMRLACGSISIYLKPQSCFLRPQIPVDTLHTSHLLLSLWTRSNAPIETFTTKVLPTLSISVMPELTITLDWQITGWRIVAAATVSRWNTIMAPFAASFPKTMTTLLTGRKVLSTEEGLLFYTTPTSSPSPFMAKKSRLSFGKKSQEFETRCCVEWERKELGIHPNWLQ